MRRNLTHYLLLLAEWATLPMLEPCYLFRQPYRSLRLWRDYRGGPRKIKRSTNKDAPGVQENVAI